MVRLMRNVWTISVCSLLLVGCSGLTLGPTVERTAVIVRAGTAVEIVEDVAVTARVLKEDGTTEEFQQHVGGWITMHPDHWETLKREFARLRIKAGEAGPAQNPEQK